MKRRVVITGLGGISPLGNNTATMWDNAVKGLCGIRPISRYNTEGRAVTLAGEVQDFCPEALFGKKESRKLGRFTQLAMAAAREAFNQSGLTLAGENPHRCGVILSPVSADSISLKPSIAGD